MMKIFKMMVFIIVGLVLLMAIAAALFINLSPQFGGNPTPQQVERYTRSDNYERGKFKNFVPTPMDMSFMDMVGVIGQFIKGVPNGRPAFELPVIKVDSIDIVRSQPTPRLTWFGHSAFLLEVGDKNILLDPMLGAVPAPHPTLGGARFQEELPVSIERLPEIDFVLFSHDHYDHLDYSSIQKLKNKVSMFYVPLGVGPHLEAWGVSSERIRELDWWEHIIHEDIQLVFTPSRHFSGRGINNRFSTLWGSWVIQADGHSIYFSGDSGYADHFKKIGYEYGPFDLALVECGQYDRRWSEIHMMPEESVQAAVDLQARAMMPIHWGAFRLALHSWTDPVERAVTAAAQHRIPIVTPIIGEQVEFPVPLSPSIGAWWQEK